MNLIRKILTMIDFKMQDENTPTDESVDEEKIEDTGANTPSEDEDAGTEKETTDEGSSDVDESEEEKTDGPVLGQD